MFKLFQRKEKNIAVIPIFIPHQGCPESCVFCNQVKISGALPNITVENAKKIINEYLEYLENRENKYIEIAFFGGSFTAIDESFQNMMLQMAKEYIDDGKVDGIRISTRPDAIDKNILKRLKSYGVTTIELGVQSADDYILKISNRGHTFKDVQNASKLIKKAGINLGHQMMVGLPESNMTDEIRTAKKLAKLKPKIMRIYPVLVIKNTKLAEMYYDNKYTPLELDEAIQICKELLKFFKSKNIKVIRVGLQNTDEISEPGYEKSEVIAGPFHEAFRELVETNIWYDRILDEISKLNVKIRKAEIIIHPKNANYVIGYKKNNIAKLKERYNIDLKIQYNMNMNIEEFKINITEKEEDKDIELKKFSKKKK